MLGNDTEHVRSLGKGGKQKHWNWGTNYELMYEETTIASFFLNTYHDDLYNYLNELELKFGPFDGVVGFCEGAAVAHVLMGMKQAGKLKGVFDSVKFFISTVSKF